MKISIDLKGLDGVKRKLDSISSELKGKVVSAAINKTAQKGKAEVTRAITEEYAVKANEVRNSMDLRTAKSSDLQAVISIFGSKSRRGRSANMIHFLAVMQAAGMAVQTRGAKVTKKQAKAVGKQLGFMIKKGGGLKQIEGAFVGNKGRTVFMREGKGRLPIKPVHVIGFSQMFNSKKISERVMQKVRSEFGTELDRAIQMMLARNS